MRLALFNLAIFLIAYGWLSLPNDLVWYGPLIMAGVIVLFLNAIAFTVILLIMELDK